jgi:hypothetical protein
MVREGKGIGPMTGPFSCQFANEIRAGRLHALDVDQLLSPSTRDASREREIEELRDTVRALRMEVRRLRTELEACARIRNRLGRGSKRHRKGKGDEPPADADRNRRVGLLVAYFMLAHASPSRALPDLR